MSTSIEIALTATSFAATVAGYSLAYWSRSHGANKIEESDKDSIEGQCRITDVRIALKKQESTSAWNSRAGSLLKIGQYIIGGLLASNFVQESVSSELVGAMGLLVLFSSLMSQSFQPEVRVRGSRQRAHQLKILLRESEDRLFEIEENDKVKIIEIRKLVSTNLAKIEEMELIESDTSKPEKNES